MTPTDLDVVEELCGGDDHVARHRALLPWLGAIAGEEVLEVGCGSGVSTTEFVAMTGGRVRLLAVDASRAAVDAARARVARYLTEALAAAVAFETMDGRRLAIAEPRFDGAFCCRVLGHATSPDLVVSEMLRVVRPGGRLLCIEEASATLNGVEDDLRPSVQGAVTPFFGRRLPDSMLRAGAASVTVVRHVQSTTRRPDVSELRARFERGTGLAALAVARRRCDERDVHRWFDRLEAASNAPNFVETVEHHAVLATKP